MSRGYYFVVPSLPPLSLHIKPDLTFHKLMQRLELWLSQDDLAKVRALRLLVDICNIRSLFLEEEIDPRGNLSEKELDEALLVQAELPDYVFQFLSQFEKVPDKIRNFSGLLTLFFNEGIAKNSGFLRDYLQFEREVRLVLLGLRAKRLKRDLVKELQFEDPTDPFVAHLLAQNDAADYDPPAEYRELKEKISASAGDPLLEFEACNEFRFAHIQEKAESEYFSIDQILCYIVQLMTLESNFELDTQKGYQILDTFKGG